MKKITFAVSCLFLDLLLLMMSGGLPIQPVRAIGGQWPGYKTLTIEESEGNTPMTVDPANCFDSVSAELISNIYETLIGFEGERTDCFIPRLATQITIAPADPLTGAPTYTLFQIYIQIRLGTSFHTWCRSDIVPTPTWPLFTLTPADVEYSLERVMVHNYPGGPGWMLTEPLLDSYTVTPSMGQVIDNSVESNATHVWINVANPGLEPYAGNLFAPVNMFVGGLFDPYFWSNMAMLPFSPPHIYSDPLASVLFEALAQPWCSILSKDWIISYVDPWLTDAGIDMNPNAPGIQTDWLGSWANWTDYLGWTQSPLDWLGFGYALIRPGMTCGTGPYIFNTYTAVFVSTTSAPSWSAVQFNSTNSPPGYWGPWPAHDFSPPYPSTDPNILPSGIYPAGYVDNLTVLQRPPMMRVNDMISGNCDFADIPRTMAYLLHHNGPYSETLKGIRLNFPIPSLKVESMHFTFNITPTPGNAYGMIDPSNTLNTAWIPSNFFADINVRRAFTYLINFTWIINNQMIRGAYQPKTCAPNGLPYVNSANPMYGPDQNIPAARSAFMAAFSGLLWTTGFNLTICYDAGNTVRQAIANKLAADVALCNNPLFTVNTVGVPWPTYVTDMRAAELPLFFASWVPDYFDIQGYMLQYLGFGPGFECGFAYAQRYTAPPSVLSGLQIGLRTANGPGRQAIYYLMEQLYYNDVPSVPLYVPIERGYMRSWVAGHYDNPLSHGIYAYDQWKWNYLRGNVNYNKQVWIGDLNDILNAFGSYFGKSGMPWMQERWNFHCDVDGNPKDSFPPGDGGWRDRKIDMYDISACLDNLGKWDTVWIP